MKTKKIICLILTLMLIFSFVACDDKGGQNNTSNNEESKSEEVVLSKDNIYNYLNFEGEFVDGDYTMGTFVNWAEATLEFQSYPLVRGSFSNVEITLIATSDDSTFTYMNKFGDYWHLTDASEEDERHIKISFKVPVDGNFNKKYSVECLNNTGKLDGDCDFEIVSVSGTFIPNK